MKQLNSENKGNIFFGEAPNSAAAIEKNELTVSGVLSVAHGHHGNAIAEALNSAPDVQQALERTLALVAELLGLQTGWIWLLDGTGEFL